MTKDVRIKLNEEQTLKFLSFFVDDAIKIVNERKQQKNKINAKHGNTVVSRR